MRITFAIVAAVLSLCCSALPTSILVDVKADSIIIASDSKAEFLPVDEHDTVHEEGASNICKLRLVGNIVFAAHGHGKSDSWDAAEVAKRAIEKHRSLNSPLFLPPSMGPDELFLAANDWASEMTDKVTKLYRSNPERVRAMIQFNRPRSWQPKGYAAATQGGKGGILAGIFAGNVRGALRAYMVEVYLDENSHTMMHSSPHEIRGLHASSPTTEELITGTSARAKRVRAHAATITPEWSRDAYLIQASERYDRYVGGPVNVIEIPLGQAPRWLQNETCK